MTRNRIVKYFIPLFCFGLSLFVMLKSRAELHTAIRTHWSGQSPRDPERREEHDHPDWSWSDLFSYVPYAVEDCTELFRGRGEYTPVFKAAYDTFLAEVEKHKITEGTSANYKEEFLAYIEAVQAPFIRTVCETGFNGGHSTFTWLAANPKTHVYSFDLSIHDYAKPMARYLMERFPGRLNVTWGDSKQTLPKFRSEKPDVRCDLIIIDGGHDYETCKSDFDNFRQMANMNNIVILDNYPDARWGFLPKLGAVWENAKRNAEVAEIYNCHYKESKQGFSVGRMMLQ